MKKDVIIKLSQSFEEAVHIEDAIEYWMARDLQALFEYAEWENFANVITKAQTACEKSNNLKSNHFREVTKMVDLGSGSQRKILDYQLSRYACYLVAQNGDPRKEPVAFAQSYFALQTRKQELLEKQIKKEEAQLLVAFDSISEGDRDLAVREIAKKDYREIVEALLASGKISDEDRGLAVCEAARNGLLKIVEVLLASGKILDKHRGLAQQLAKREGHRAIARML
jgi:cysteinyl-tRNA synthetase